MLALARAPEQVASVLALVLPDTLSVTALLVLAVLLAASQGLEEVRTHREVMPADWAALCRANEVLATTAPGTSKQWLDWDLETTTCSLCLTMSQAVEALG